jgi:outer membrane biosynthesis protein TonB
MKTRPLAVALLLSLAPAVAVPPGVAFAQAGADDTTTKMARARFQEGVAFFDKHEYEQARAAFLQAYALRKHPVVLLNLAQSSLKSGHTLESARYFQTFLHDYSAATQAQRSDAETGLAEANTKLGRIDVSSAPSGAEVWVDDQREGVAPFDHPIEVEPGSHAVGARGRGGDESVQVNAPAGQVVTARFGAPPPAATAAPPVVAPAPTPAPEPTPEPAPSPAPEPGPSVGNSPPQSESSFLPSNTAPLWIGGIVTLAGFGTAIVMGIEKSSAQNSANSVASQIEANVKQNGGVVQGACNHPTGDLPGPCSVLSNDNSKVNTDALIANIGLGVGIGAAALTVLYFAIGSRDSSSGTSAPSASTRPVVTPLVGKGLGGLAVGASF